MRKLIFLVCLLLSLCACHSSKMRGVELNELLDRHFHVQDTTINDEDIVDEATFKACLDRFIPSVYQEMELPREIERDEVDAYFSKLETDIMTSSFPIHQTHIEYVDDYNGEVFSLDQPPGIYLYDGQFYQVDDQMVTPLNLEDVVADLEIQNTMVVDFEKSVQFPDNTVFSDEPLMMHDDGVMRLGTPRYFNFMVGDYRLSGGIHQGGFTINVKNRDFRKMTLDNTLSLSNFKITTDISLKASRFLVRLDYDLKDQFSLKKERSTDITKQVMNSNHLAFLKNKVQHLQPLLPKEANLDLLTFDIPIPGNIPGLSCKMKVGIDFSLSGEANVTFSASSSQGSLNQTTLAKQRYAIEPYLEGKCEIGTKLQADLCYYDYLLTDLSVKSGFGSALKTQLHFVDTKTKQVDEFDSGVCLSDLESYLGDYAMNKDAFVETCIDGDVYGFMKIGFGNGKKSLPYRLGLNHTFTPLKETLSLLHIEDHKNVGRCTRVYHFNEDVVESMTHQLSDYRVTINCGETYQITALVNGRFYSEDENICHVDQQGCIYAVQPGTTTIIFEDEAGYQSYCTVVIYQDASVPFVPLASSFFCFMYKLCYNVVGV